MKELAIAGDRNMNIRLLSVLVIGLGFILSATPSGATDTDRMLTACRAQASRQLGVPPDIINVHFEGRMADGSYAFNGDTETTPPMLFECSIQGRNARRPARASFGVPRGCPVDVSQADRYKYPACN